MRKDSIENSFDKLGEFLGNFSHGDIFVMESTGFYEPLCDFIEFQGFSVKLANPLQIKLIAESRMKNDDVDSKILAKLLRNDWIPESYVTPKEIREIRRFVRTRIQISQTMRSYKNRTRYELLRMHVDYEVDPFTNKGKIFLWNLCTVSHSSGQFTEIVMIRFLPFHLTSVLSYFFPSLIFLPSQSWIPLS